VSYSGTVDNSTLFKSKTKDIKNTVGRTFLF